MSTVAILINGRLGSTRCPKKLVRPFANSTLFEIAMKKLSEIDYSDGCYVGVGEDPLISVVNKYPNLNLLLRSKEAVAPGYNDHKIIYAHYKLIEADYIMWLNPCHPLISHETIKNAINFVKKTKYNSYTSVVECNDWIFSEDGLPMTNRSASMLSTAHSKKFFKAAHAFHVINKNYFLKDYQIWSLTKNDPYMIQISDDENYDVNTENEFFITEQAYKNHIQ